MHRNVPAGCISPDNLEPECLPALPDICPSRPFPLRVSCASHGSNDNGTWSNNVYGCWQGEPLTGVSPYAAVDFTYPMVGEGASSGAVTELRGEVERHAGVFRLGRRGWRSTGEGPYRALSSGSTARFGVLNASGQIRVWGNTAGAFGAPPTTTGFTELGVGRDVGCAVGIANGGVSCWGGQHRHAGDESEQPVDPVPTLRWKSGATWPGAVQDDEPHARACRPRLAPRRASSPAERSSSPTDRPRSVGWSRLGESGPLIGVA